MLQILDSTEANLKLTTRDEKHGDQNVPAVTLGLTLMIANTLLDTIDPTIRHALFKRHDGQDELPGMEPSTPVLRCNAIDKVALGTKHEGWTLEIDDGIDETTPHIFGACKVDGISVEPKQGGSCVLRMRVGTSDLDAERSGFLGMHVGQSVWIRLRAPERANDVPLDELDEEGADEPDATDLFVASAQEDPATALFGEHAAQDEPGEAEHDPLFNEPASAVPVTMRKRRKLGEGLGTDADQAARQARELAQDPTMAEAP